MPESKHSAALKYALKLEEDRKATDQYNKQPVNQVARNFLLKAKVKPDPSLLYLLQLMYWALREGKVDVVEPGNRYAREDTLGVLENLMYQRSPHIAMNLLLKEGPEGDPHREWVDPKVFVRFKKPDHAAATSWSG